VTSLFQAQPSASIADSFPGMDAMQPVTAQQRPVTVQQLKKPPKWLKRPVGARFGFGGKLVSFAKEADGIKPKVTIERVITEPELVERSLRLETSIANQNVPEFCQVKAEAAVDEDDKQLWKFIGASFADSPRLEFLDLLGFNGDEIAKKVENASGVVVSEPEISLADGSQKLADDLSRLDTTDAREGAFEEIAAKATAESPVEPELTAFNVSVSETTRAGLVNSALLSGNIDLAVELCCEADPPRWADALVLSQRGGHELTDRTIKRYLKSAEARSRDETNLIRAVVGAGEWRDFVQRCQTSDWRQALVAAVTYAGNDEFSSICAELGDRLESSGDAKAAMLCYVCAADLNKLVAIWLRTKNADASPKALQDLVEVLMSLRCAAERLGVDVQPEEQSGDLLSQKLAQYASLLAAQGALSAALTYLGPSGGDQALRERLTGALGRAAAAVVAAKHDAAGRRSRLTSTSSNPAQGSRLSERHNNYCSSFCYVCSSVARRKSSAQSVTHQPPSMYQPQPPSSSAASGLGGGFVSPTQTPNQPFYSPSPQPPQQNLYDPTRST